MATGSGKTKVIGLAIAWQYFNAVLENPAEYARTSLIIAPNVIVFERLKLDFGGGRIFRADPVIPPELKLYWDVESYMRGDGERATSQGAIYLTNIQQLYEREDAAKSNDEPDIMTAVLGPRPPAQTMQTDGFEQRIVARGGPVFVANDEAHHTHDEDSEWNKGIRRLHTSLTRATPRSPCLGRAGGALSPSLAGRGDGGWVRCPPTRRFRHPALQQGRPVHLDRLRLPAQAGDHRQRHQAADQGHHAGRQGSAVGHRQRALPGLPDRRRGTVAGVSQPIGAAQAQAGALPHAEQHPRRRRRGRLSAGQVSGRIRRR